MITRRAIPKLFFLTGLIFLFGTIIIRHNAVNLFYALYATPYSAHAIPFPLPVLWFFLKNVLFKIYLNDYLLPACLLLLPSIFFLAIGFSSLPGLRHLICPNLLAFLKDKKAERNFPLILFFVSFITFIIIRFFLLGNFQPWGDEFCYMFQADLLTQGKLFAPSFPLPDFFHHWSIINDGKWYSKVTLGWPLLLAAGRLIKRWQKKLSSASLSSHPDSAKRQRKTTRPKPPSGSRSYVF